ncbi:MAG TPA: MFS transporter [Anaerolineaceae bacterium]|nr:MFS transporter [Anaerolineaceae bacterium]
MSRLRHHPLLAPMDPVRVYLIFTVASALFQSLAWTVAMVYFIQVAGLDALQMVLVGTALEVSIFLLEVPTGVVADLYSRRVSVIAGSALIGLGFILTGFLPLFVPILIAQLIWGAGWTLTSGALQAWISDEVGEERAGQAFLQGARAAALAGLVATAVSVVIAGRVLSGPIVIGGALYFLLALFLLAFMPEQGWRPITREAHSAWGHMRDTLRDAYRVARRRPALRGILAVGLFFGLYSEGFDRLWTAHLLERFIFPDLAGLPQIYWFGLISIVTSLLTAGALAWVERRRLRLPHQLAAAQGLLSAGLLASLVLFALADNFWLALLFYWLIGTAREVISPLYTAWVNHGLEPGVRATVHSAAGQVDAIGQIAGGPLVGVIARSAGLQAGLLMSAGLLAPVLALLAWQVFRREPVKPEPAAD